MRSLAVFGGLVAAVLGLGLLFPPGAWYAALVKPAWTPPPAVFALWLPLYVAIAAAGWLVWRAEDSIARSIALWLWGFQLALNAAWTPCFFGLHQPLVALGIVLALLAVICAAVGWMRVASPAAAWLFAPYIAWVAFAATLNAGIVALN